MKKYISIIALVALLTVGTISAVVVADDNPAQAYPSVTKIPVPLGDCAPYDDEELFTAAGDPPDGTVSYMLYEHWGGYWCDAEKVPNDDGKGNPAPNNPGDEDDLLCWAAAASNMLEWTGWGFVGTLDDTDDMFQYFQDHTTDYGSLIPYGLEWWWDGNLPTHGSDWSVEDVEGGNFWESTKPSWNTYAKQYDGADTLTYIDQYLHEGRAVGLGIWDGGHAITCWGIQINPDYDATEPDSYYRGIWITDSDNSKNQWSPPDTLNYVGVEKTVAGHWTLCGYGCGWSIEAVTGLLPFPETRPVADAGTSYTGNEGSAITFDGSGSSDADGDPLEYRWDFDNDHVWDTAWSSDPEASHTWYEDYSGTVVLEVDDGRLRDVDTATVTVNNVAPAVTVGVDTIDEDGTAAISGTITDPGTEDTFTVEIDWGEGSPESFSYPAGSTTYNETHQYLDDDPTGTPSDGYTVSVTVTDDDGGSGTGSGTVTVDNVAPSVTVTGDTINEDGTATVSGTITDPGTEDTFTVEIDWGEGSPESFSYPAGATAYSETHQYLDDNPTGDPSNDYTVTVTVTDDDTGIGTGSDTVTVNNVDPVVTGITMDQPNSQFILPAVHELDFTGTFTDVGTQDDHTAVWDWGDMSTSPGTVDETDGSGTVTGSHTYAAAGDYTVTLTVTDDDTGYHSNTYSVHVEDVDEALIITNNYIQDLDDSCFSAKNVDRQKASIDSTFHEYADKWANEAYKGLIKNLKNMRAKADGSVDGNEKNDWIICPTAQDEICHKIDDITAYLETLL